MDSVVELENKIQSINEARTNTANYFKKHNEFKYDPVSLMEISFTHHHNSNSLSDTNINNSHNLLTQHIRIKNIPTIKEDIGNYPYFATRRLEFWVSKTIALQLIAFLRYEHEADMPLHVRESNKTKLIDRLEELLSKICVSFPLKINKLRIIEPIESLYLAWIFAICRRYKSYEKIDYNDVDVRLDAAAYNFIKKLTDLLMNSEKDLGMPTYSIQYDLPKLISKYDVYSYKISPDLIPLIASHDDFSELFVSKEEPCNSKQESKLDDLNSKELAHPSPNPLGELQNHEKNEKKKLLLRDKLKNSNNRPSYNCRDKTQITLEEFETIIIDGHLDLDSLNLHTLSKVFIQRAKEKKNNHFAWDDSEKIVRDKYSQESWSTARTKQHREKIIIWVEEVKNKK